MSAAIVLGMGPGAVYAYEKMTKIGKSLPQIPIKKIMHISDSVVSAEYHLPAGAMLGKHMHNYSHLSILASGTAIIYKQDSDPLEVSALSIVNIEANKWHSVEAKTDVVWLCTHGANESNETFGELA